VPPPSDWRPRDGTAGGTPAAGEPVANDDSPGVLADWEKQAISTALRESAWNVSRAAKRLDITRNTLYQKISKYGIKKSPRSR